MLKKKLSLRGAFLLYDFSTSKRVYHYFSFKVLHIATKECYSNIIFITIL